MPGLIGRNNMALFDSLSKGASFIDQLQKGKMLDEDARRYAENSEIAKQKALEDLFKLRTNNKYLDEFNMLRNQGTTLDNAHKGLVNDWYAPNMKSEIAYRNAGTGLLGEQTKYYGPNILSEIEYRKSGGSRGGVTKQEYDSFVNQVTRDNPNASPQEVNQYISSYLQGENSLPNGQPVPALSGQAQTFLTFIQNRKSGRSIQNQAANADITAQDINRIDIEPAKKFAGLKGKIDLAAQKARMAAGYEVDPDARDYLAFQREAILAMDSMRNSLKTSVVPAYVSATLGKLTNPDAPIWNDATQVQKEWDVLKKWVNNNSEMLNKKARQGPTADVSKIGSNEPKQKMVPMITPDGRRISIPEDKVEEAIKLKARSING